MKPVLPTSFFVVLCLALFLVKAQAQCDLTQADLIGASGSFTIPAGQTLCITADFCMGTSSNFPGACANTGPASLHIEGTLRINDNVTFKYQGSVVGSGKIQILQAARMSLFGTIDCSGGLTIHAVDPAALGGPRTVTHTGVLSCNSFSCEPHFANNYAPFGVVAEGLGFNGTACAAIIGFPDDKTLLPINFSRLAARRDGEGVLLTWTTASEQNNAGFEIQRSVNGRQWDVIGKHPTAVPGGNSQSILQYAFRDRAPLSAATLYYRLRQTDIDGRSMFSSIVQVKEQNFRQARIYAAPGVIQIVINSDSRQSLQLQAAGAGGRVVYKNVIAPDPGLNRYSINTSQWAKGVYIVSLQTPQETIREKILVQ
ncbi:hypothetical protein [Paraflavitalea sp. CAU 1676]|uniref:hypothetical protein n=1 Tax=Paraflavitalea sp. CAU 1676 TaxID=3032598 RepID=UPI0023DB51A9|nr:hypothetical protein [Paraflavitalea sp. CAU 1676]MDF2191971.1 hypothetical protein [Paraflavitalea sp. CAU 1676]